MSIKEYKNSYVSLSDVIKTYNGITSLPKDYKIDGNYKLLDYKTVYKKQIINDYVYDTLPLIKIFDKDHRKSFDMSCALVCTWSSETNKDIFQVSYVQSRKKIILNGFCKGLIVTDDRFISKWLYYYLNSSKAIQKIRESIVYTTRCNMSNSILKSIKIPIIDIKTQQQIIDIIEPKENLFIKYKDLVNIESLDEFKKTWSILIDIIEPFEKLKQNLNRTLFMISNLMDSINLYVKPIGLMKDFNVIFEKGKNIPSDLITTSKTKIPFINVSAINNNINKYIIDNDIFHENITYGDVVLSLDGTIGLVNNFVSGINGYGYKVYSDTIHESIIYYSLLNKINFDIISKCSKGSVIKHASSSKDKLLIFDYKEINIKAIYGLEIMVKNKLLLIDKIIKYSIEKYVL